MRYSDRLGTLLSFWQNLSAFSPIAGKQRIRNCTRDYNRLWQQRPTAGARELSGSKAKIIQDRAGKQTSQKCLVVGLGNSA